MAPDHQVLDILKRFPATEVQQSLAEAFNPLVLQSQLQQHLQNQSQPTQQQRISFHDAVHIVHRELQDKERLRRITDDIDRCYLCLSSEHFSTECTVPAEVRRIYIYIYIAM